MTLVVRKIVTAYEEIFLEAAATTVHRCARPRPPPS